MTTYRPVVPPEIGMGATIYGYSDKHAATIVDIIYYKSGAKKGTIRSIVVQKDHAKRTDSYGMSEIQEYEYTPDPTADLEEFRFTSKGFWQGKSAQLGIGARRSYHDYSF